MYIALIVALMSYVNVGLTLGALHIESVLCLCCVFVVELEIVFCLIVSIHSLASGAPVQWRSSLLPELSTACFSEH